ncbi:tyrosine-type recombinase/integrase [Clostridium sp.]|uniref:tyrosine-type recombinase/integrase n=1 Tax=Clostridium sp. TaxID=1506 RepID=UPI0025811F61|nr:tyrosine-type recombinase/integrase [Clostridium sp.]MDU7240682.1 tyrosine-type recombinase/integrase [Clostridium sp.]
MKVPRKAKEQLTDHEYEKFIKSINLTKFHEYRDYIIINLIFDTGMRLSETLSLIIHDIDLSRRTIYIPAEVTKGRKDRVTFFSITMSKWLNRWIRYKDTIQESDLLFPTQRTNGLLTAYNFERNFREYLKRVNIEKNITPHTLRNNFARRFLISGGDIYTLSKILGHSSVMVTEKAYLDLMDEDFRKRYQRFSPLENMRK